MFAKLSPDAGRVAYVRSNNVYVETLDDGSIVQLTHDGSETTINGTSDWVYEEELGLRDGFRWSTATFGGASLDAPDGVAPLLLFSDGAIDHVGPARLRRSAADRNQGVALAFVKGKPVILGAAAMLFDLDDASVQNRHFAIPLLQWLAARLDSAGRTGCHPREA